MNKLQLLHSAIAHSSVAKKTRSHASAISGAALIAITVAVTAMPVHATAQSATQASPEGPTSIQEVYHDWIVTCRQGNAEAANPTSICQMNQELRDKKSGQLILSLVVPAQPLQDGANAVLIAPFGLDLASGVTLALLAPQSATGDDAADIAARTRDPRSHANFRTCLPAGCLANFKLNSTMKNALRNGERAVVSMMSADQSKPVNVSLSLRGFTAAERRLTSLAQKFE